MGIFYYGPDLGGSSHLWMRRQFKHFEDLTDVLIEHENPDFEIPEHIDLVVLPKRVSHSSRTLRFFLDVRTDIMRRQILREHITKPDIILVVVHFLTNAVPYIKVWEQFKKPVFVHCHGIDVTWEKTGSNRTWRKIWWGDYVNEVKKLPQNVAFVANSDRTKKQLLKIGIHEKRIYVNNIGVPIPKKIPDRRGRENLVKILFIGRLADVKGPLLTIKAFEIACKKGLQGELILAGDGPLYSECQALIDASKYKKNIKLLGAVSAERGEQLRMEADVFSAHSRKGPDTLQEEAYGVAFIEAMAAGLPVVTGHSGSLPEIVRDGVDGILFHPGDIEHHAESLLKVWKNPDKRILMGNSGRDRAISNYSLEKEMKGLEEIYAIAKN